MHTPHVDPSSPRSRGAPPRSGSLWSGRSLPEDGRPSAPGASRRAMGKERRCELLSKELCQRLTWRAALQLQGLGAKQLGPTHCKTPRSPETPSNKARKKTDNCIWSMMRKRCDNSCGHAFLKSGVLARTLICTSTDRMLPVLNASELGSKLAATPTSKTCGRMRAHLRILLLCALRRVTHRAARLQVRGRRPLSGWCLGVRGGVAHRFVSPSHLPHEAVKGPNAPTVSPPGCPGSMI